MTRAATTSEFSAVDRRALASVAVQFFVNGAAYASFVPRLPEIRQRTGLGLDGLGLAMSLGVGIGLIGSLLAPSAIDRWGTRRTLLWGGTMMVAGLPLVGFATAPVVLVVGLAMMSAADGLVDVSMNLQGSWLSARRHAPVMNRLHGLWSLGTVTGGLVAAQAAAARLSLPVHLSVTAVALAVALTWVGAGLLRTDEDHDADQDAGHAETAADENGPSPRARPARAATPRAALVALALSGAFAVTVELVSSDWAAFRLVEDLGTSAGLAGLGFVAFTVGMTTGRMGGDAVVARFGGDAVFRGAVGVSGVGLTFAAFGPEPWLVLAGYLVAGLGVSTFFPKLYDDSARTPGRRGAGIAWLRTGSGVTVLIMPTVVGVLASTTLSVGQSLAIVTLPSLAGLLAVTAYRRRLVAAAQRAK